MSALDRILDTAREAKVSAACQWINYREGEERAPQVTVIADDRRWTLFFDKGKRGWLLKSAATSTRTLTTLASVLDMIVAEGERRDAVEQAARDALEAQIAYETGAIA